LRGVRRVKNTQGPPEGVSERAEEVGRGSKAWDIQRFTKIKKSSKSNHLLLQRGESLISPTMKLNHPELHENNPRGIDQDHHRRFWGGLKLKKTENHNPQKGNP